MRSKYWAKATVPKKVIRAMTSETLRKIAVSVLKACKAATARVNKAIKSSATARSGKEGPFASRIKAKK